jgi:hypothetical protein
MVDSDSFKIVVCEEKHATRYYAIQDLSELEQLALFTFNRRRRLCGLDYGSDWDPEITKSALDGDGAAALQIVRDRGWNDYEYEGWKEVRPEEFKLPKEKLTSPPSHLADVDFKIQDLVNPRH